jgi:hypothetical protein
MSITPKLSDKDFTVTPRAIRALRCGPVYNLHQANAQVSAADAVPEFSGDTMYQLLSRRFGPVKKDIVEVFSLHTGKDKRTVHRYLSGELAIPRWVVFVTMILCEKSSDELYALWVQARKASEDYPKI